MTPALDPDRVVAVEAGELDEWAWLMAFMEEWLANSEIETRDDFAHHGGRCGPRLGNVVATFDNMAIRTWALAGGRP